MLAMKRKKKKKQKYASLLNNERERNNSLQGKIDHLKTYDDVSPISIKREDRTDRSENNISVNLKILDQSNS